MKIAGDYLNRYQSLDDVKSIIESCLETKTPITFSIEGDWGKGKSWFIEKLEDLLKGQDLTNTNNKREKSIKKYLVFKYNAWEKDYYEEPLLAILITLINQLNKELILENTLKSGISVVYEETKDILEEALGAISKKIIGFNILESTKKGFRILKSLKKGAKIKVNSESSDNIEKDIKTVVKALNKLSKSKPLIFIIDELDRCIPSHSIKTLERLHHIFSKVDSSVTIISINENQLKNTVELMFGDKVSFESYIRKFLDFRINLDVGKADADELGVKLKTYYDLFGLEGDFSFRNQIISDLCGLMTPREFEKVCNNALLCHKFVKGDTKLFSKDYVIGEILLFSSKLANSKEGNTYNILPTNMNTTHSQLGKYIKDFLRKLPIKASLDLDNSLNMILYICAEGLDLIDRMELTYTMENEDLLKEIESYYKSYVKYYRLVII